MMKLTYDRDVDAVFIQLVEYLPAGGVEKTVELNESVMLDFNAEGKLVGIEILDASKVLDKKVLDQASV